MSLLFQYIRFGKFIMDESEEAWDDPAIQKIIEMTTPLELLRISDYATERNKAAFDVLVCLWPLLKEEIELLKNPQQQQQSGSQQQNHSGQAGQSGQNAQQKAQNNGQSPSQSGSPQQSGSS